MKRTTKRMSNLILSVLLTVIMCVSMIPSVSFADSTLIQDDQTTIESEQQTVSQDDQANDPTETQGDSTDTQDDQMTADSDDQTLSVPDTSAAIDTLPTTDDMSSEASSTQDAGDASFVMTEENLTAVDVEGEATRSQSAAAAALVTYAELDRVTADETAAALFDVGSAEATFANNLPTSADGSTVDSITAKWITQDTVDNGDESLLYLKPSDDNDQSVRMQINYALSGEFDYDPGDIVITIPASMFKDRDGNDIGTLILPYPEDPSTSTDFNWKLVDGNYVITNTIKMSAATKGFIQFDIVGLTPHKLVDMALSNPFSASIEVITNQGNVIGSTSNELTAQIDTESQVTHANKRLTRDPVRVDASQIPESQRVAGETEYVVVTWYMWSYEEGNQPYSLTLTDTKGDTYQGFVIGATSADGQSKDIDVFNGYKTGDSRYTTVKVAYPFSQFAANTTYTFKNDASYKLTEIDPASGGDPQKVTTQTASSQVDWSWHPQEFSGPAGSFGVYKNGNDNTKKYGIGKETHEPRWGWRVSDILSTGSAGRVGYYGIYTNALNKINSGTNADISYTIDSVGYLLPYTLEDGADDKVLANYGKKPVTMTTTDTGLTVNGGALEVGTDFTYKSVEFAYKPYICKAQAVNLNPDGTIPEGSTGDATITYVEDTDMANIPPIRLEVERDGVWSTYATANWSSGSLVITLADSSAQTSSIVTLPAGITDVRTVVTATNAAVQYYIRPVVTLTAQGAMKAITTTAFAASVNPLVNMYNSTNLTATQDQGATTLASVNQQGYDKLYGYTADTKAIPHKSATQTTADVDWNNRLVTVHYTAQVNEQSFISDQTTYESALEDATLLSETSGMWYDLLPKGMTPDMSSIKLRDGDSITQAYTIENYKGTGRTLLVVKAKLTPTPSQYSSGGLTYYEDVPSITFDAIYGFDAIVDYTDKLHNVIAFESGNDTIGSIEGYEGETDNPYGTNNVSTATAFATDKEKVAMTDLNPDRDTPSFVYAGMMTQLDILAAGRTSLSKEVSVNNDGYWSAGTYNDTRTVYEGGQYSYRLRVMSEDTTVTKNMVFYDAIEVFEPSEGNDPVDIGAPRWQGTFTGIDVSQLETKGCAPVVYYSTVPGLVLEKEDGISPTAATDLTDTTIWSTTPPADLSTVTAVAVDASKKADGTSFEVAPLESVVVIVNMHAPSGTAAAGYIANNAHAYNNAYMFATSVDFITEASEDHFIRKDYTKVGLEEYNLTVTKVFDDGDNRDGIRPASVTVHLYQDGVDSGRTLVLDEANGWVDEFKNLPYTNDDGTKIIYSLAEDDVTGYAPSISVDGLAATLTNRHVPETIDVAGKKTWTGDSAEVRPASIQVNLLANGTVVQTQTITPDEEDNWNYSFDDVYKYEGGHEIVYTVSEVRDEGTVAYVPSVTGTDISNTYHPYGDLTLSKTVTDTSQVTQDQTFTFTLRFQKDGGALFDEFAYTTSDGRTGTVGTDGTIELKGGQSATITEIPQGVTYQVTEQSVAGFSNIATTGSTGTIVANDTQQASFTNRYAASVPVNLSVTKVLENHELQHYQFRFQLRDENGKVIRTATSGSADSVQTDAGGTVVSSTGQARFGTIRYTQADHGKTFVYDIAEIDSGKPGYAYDTTVYKAIVKPIDNGDGTMSVSVTYTTEEGTTVDKVTFTNSYTAAGSVTPRFYKQLQGRDLTAGEFTFEIGKVTTTGNTAIFTPIGNTTNDAAGTVTFADITYDQSDIGKTYLYAIHETVGHDATVVYDGHYELIAVTVTDNGDATLSAATTATGLSCPCFVCAGNDPNCPACGGTGTITSSANPYVFSNDLQDGGLDITKLVTGETTGSDPNQAFKFRVELSNTNGDPVDIDTTKVTIEPVNTGFSLASQVVKRSAATPETLSMADGTPLVSAVSSGVGALQTQASEYALAPLAESVSGTSGGCTWLIDTNGKLTVSPTDGVSGTLGAGCPWSDYSTQITSARFESGVIANADSSAMFSKCTNMTTCDIAHLDTSQVTTMYEMFFNCSSLVSLDLANFNTANVTSMKLMFCGCSSLPSLTFPATFTTANVTTMDTMFAGCSHLASLNNLSSFNTSNVTDMYDMFAGCSSLTSLDLSNFNTVNVALMDTMFTSCSSLTSLDLSSFNTSNVTRMNYMFLGCTSLTSLNLSSFDTSHVTAMEYAFTNCTALSEVTLGSNFSFKGSGSSILATLPDSPTTGGYTGNWIIADKSKTAVSASDLASNYPTDEGGAYPAGTYIWAELTPYTINFDKNGGTGEMSSQSGNPAFDIAIKPNAFSHFGYSFAGWNTAANGSGTPYAAGATIPANTMTEGSTLDLFAQWTKLDIIEKVTEGVYEVELPGNAVMHLSDSLPAGTAYRVYEQTPSGWTLVSSGNTSGVIEPLVTANPTFTNAYSPGTASAQIHGTKTLDGDYATTAENFSFQLWEGETLLQTKTATNGGNIQFDPITYTAAGTHTYTVREVTGVDPDINYDTHVETLTVAVVDDTAGNLSTTVTYDASGLAFANTTKTGSLVLSKEIVGATSAVSTDQDFTFTVTFTKDGVASTQTVTLKGGASKTFADLAPGTDYSIVEADIPAGWTNTGTVGATGTIAASQTSAAVFTNTYAATGTAQMGVYKSFTNGELTAGQFTFDLLDADGTTVIATASCGDVDTCEQIPDADGNPIDNPYLGMAPVTFDKLTYTQPGVYTYYIAERIPAVGDRIPGVVYDTQSKQVTVTVTDVGGGHLNSVVAFAEGTDKIFTNSIETTGSLQVTKQVNNLTDAASTAGNDVFGFSLSLKDGTGATLTNSYPATIYDSPGAVASTSTLTDGSTFNLKGGQHIVVTHLPYGSAYTVTETDATATGWTQTGVTGEASGTLGADLKEVIFTNDYAASGTAVMNATKTFDDTLTAGQFTFQVTDATGAVVSLGTNDAQGHVTFAPIAYSDADNGKTFTYYISERPGDASTAYYDTHTVMVTVVPTDNGQGQMICAITYEDGSASGPTFANSRIAQLARTGGVGAVLGIAGLMVVFIGLAVLLRRRRDGEQGRA